MDTLHRPTRMGTSSQRLCTSAPDSSTPIWFIRFRTNCNRACIKRRLHGERGTSMTMVGRSASQAPLMLGWKCEHECLSYGHMFACGSEKPRNNGAHVRSIRPAGLKQAANPDRPPQAARRPTFVSSDALRPARRGRVCGAKALKSSTMTKRCWRTAEASLRVCQRMNNNSRSLGANMGLVVFRVRPRLLALWLRCMTFHFLDCTNHIHKF